MEDFIEYSDQLKSEQWEHLRKVILERDKFTCQQCNWVVPKFLLFNLHIHHKCYQKGKLAWEYPHKVLITLCLFCHKKVHQTETIPIFNEIGINIGESTICDRCKGFGYILIYKNVKGGICFNCKGFGILEKLI